jgi:aspartate aminotransferase
MLSQKALMLKPSPTLAMAQRARDLAAKGNDVVSLTVGEPDWQTFPAANEAAIQAIQNGFTKYTPVNGIPELRKAIADQVQLQFHISYSPEQVCVGSGAKFVIFSALQMLLDPGDEVIIPSPYWVSYPVMVELSGGKPIIAECGEKENFKLTPEILEKHITPKSKILILCSPSNPTGLMYTQDELQKIADVLKKHPHIFVISDDIYNRLVFSGGIAPHLLTVAPELKERLLIVNGASKTYAMTGWRIGWSLGPQKLIKVMTDYMSQSTSNCSSISQKAALAAIQNCEPEIIKANQTLKEKRDWFFEEIKKIKLFTPSLPDGAFYFWVKIADGKVDSKKVADTLLDEYYLATVPGIEFGSDGYLRMSFATSKTNLQKAIERLEKFSKKF